MVNYNKFRYGLIKCYSDAHTLGIYNVGHLLEDCGFTVFIADAAVCFAVEHISISEKYESFENWIIKNRITYLGFSYRLDPKQALEKFGKLIYCIKNKNLLVPKGILKKIYFAGLPDSCDFVKREFQGEFKTFSGDENDLETLRALQVPDVLIPDELQRNSTYDEIRFEFAKNLINKEKHLHANPVKKLEYPTYGKSDEHLIHRYNFAKKTNQLPLFRAHAGPYLYDREEALRLFSEWVRQLANTGFLDILSIGSSQLSQSHFGENWEGIPNGGGVPFNSAKELHNIWQDARPMLVRAYSASNNIQEFAQVLEKTINVCWHALSFWWFNKIDGRGPLSVAEGLQEHLATLRYIALTNKPFEPNIPHHFSFRGADDISYIVSAFLAAKTSKLYGIKCLVLQNMLNTPKSIWGIADLAKSRALLKLVRRLEDKQFKVIFQPRAGLDYFSTDIEKAKVQLAAVTALMLDIEPGKIPGIIHVVSFSEGTKLASPDVINESIKITKTVIDKYSEFRHSNCISDIINTQDVYDRSEKLLEDAILMINDIEKSIDNVFSPDGLFKVFKMGYFPIPYLWESRDEFKNAVQWRTQIKNGSVSIVNEQNKTISMNERLEIIRNINNYSSTGNIPSRS